MLHLQNLTVLILGLGDSGLAMARWCAQCGSNVRVADTRSQPPQASTLAQDVPAATLHHGLDAALLDGVNLVLKSPGLAPNAPEVLSLLSAADDLGIPVQGELSLFADALADLKNTRRYAPKVLAITGTNGKTTTTALTAQLVERAGKRVGLAGNIGPTLLDTLRMALAQEPEGTQADLAAGLAADVDAAEPVFEHLPEVWVLELSSFQLDGVTHFEPSAAAVLNITQDHLDWHGSMHAYAEAKARIFGKQACMVINRDDGIVDAMVPAPQIVKSGLRGRPAQISERHVVRFGLDAPRRPGDFGLVLESGMAWLVRACELDPTLKRKKGDAEEDITLQRLMPADALRIRGRHNASNALAALALTTAIGLPLAPMLHGLREYRGEPHRVELVNHLAGVDAIDDSKGTNVGATVAALLGLGADLSPGKLVIILGGDGKGQDFGPLLAPVSRFARAVALIGRDAGVIEQALSAGGRLSDPLGAHIPMVRHDNLEAATRWAFDQALQGDAVLLSPACASLDMFRNYGHRAQVFVDTVRELALERGDIA